MPALRKPSGLNPRDRRPGDRRTMPPGARPVSAVWYVLGFLFLIVLAQAWCFKPPGRAITYSEFKQLLRSDQIAELTVGEQTIHGTTKQQQKDGSNAFTATRIEDPKLVEELDAHKVKY